MKYCFSVIKFIFSLLLMWLLITSCSHIGGMDENFTERNSSTLTVIATSNNQLNFGSSARSVLPSAIDTSTLKFYIWGTDKTLNSDYKIKKISFSASRKNPNEGFVDIDIKKGVYELNLAASQTDIIIENYTNENAIKEVQKEALFFSSITVDLRYIDEVKFFLKPCTSGGKGQALLKLYTTWDWIAGLTTDCGIFNMTTDEPVWHSENCLTEVSHALPDTPNFNSGDVAPGIYNLKITFITAEGVKYIYSDTLTIFSNQITSATIEVPNIIEKFPSAAPANLTAAYAAPDNKDLNYYYCEFCWDDNSNNENYFQLELLDITGANSLSYSSNPFTGLSDSERDTLWTTIKNTSNVKHFEYNPDNYGDSSVESFQYLNGDGSLLPNNNYIVYKFPLERKYFARLCAATGRGKSSYSYVDFSSSRALETTNLSSASFTKFNSDSICLNVYRITYNYCGGNFYNDSTNQKISVNRFVYNNQLATSATQPQIIYPVNYSYDSSDVSLKASLKNGNYAWQGWSKDGINLDFIEFTESAGVFSCEYSDYKNLSLFANYSGSASETQLIVNNDILAQSIASTDVSTITYVTDSSKWLSSSGKNSFVVDKYVEGSTNRYIAFYALADSYTAASTLTVQKNGGVSTVYSCEGGAAKTLSSMTNAYIYLVDINGFTEGNYIATYNLIPNENADNPVNFTFTFIIE